MKPTTMLHVGPAQQEDPHIKHAQARQLRSEIDAFVAAGGKIERLANGDFGKAITDVPSHLSRANTSGKKKKKTARL